MVFSSDIFEKHTSWDDQLTRKKWDAIALNVICELKNSKSKSL